ncbi:hypothetical protein HAX54_045809, partial [Datura stramonium]|nr:hypothetical protein [Datura stramonium]
MTFGDSPVGSGETPMERRSNMKLALGQCLDPALHWRFMDRTPYPTRRCVADA